MKIEYTCNDRDMQAKYMDKGDIVHIRPEECGAFMLGVVIKSSSKGNNTVDVFNFEDREIQSFTDDTPMTRFKNVIVTVGQ